MAEIEERVLSVSTARVRSTREGNIYTWVPDGGGGRGVVFSILPDWGDTPSFLTVVPPCFLVEYSILPNRGGYSHLADPGGTGTSPVGTGWGYPLGWDWMWYSSSPSRLNGGTPHPSRTRWGNHNPPPPSIRIGWQLNTLYRGRYAFCGFPQEDFLVSINFLFTIFPKFLRSFTVVFLIIWYFLNLTSAPFSNQV